MFFVETVLPGTSQVSVPPPRPIAITMARFLCLLAALPQIAAKWDSWGPKCGSHECDFMETCCGTMCCKFMNTCSEGVCCSMGQEACGGSCCEEGQCTSSAQCCPKHTIAVGKECLPKTCENLLASSCNKPGEPTETKINGVSVWSKGQPGNTGICIECSDGTIPSYSCGKGQAMVQGTFCGGVRIQAPYDSPRSDDGADSRATEQQRTAARIAELKEAIKQAVDSEDYKTAARLQAELQKLQEEPKAQENASRIAELKAAIKKAVEDQDYATAARLQAELKAMQPDVSFFSLLIAQPFVDARAPSWSVPFAPLVAAAAALLLVLTVAYFVRGSSASGTQAAHVAEVGYYEVEKALHSIAGTIEKTFVHPTKDAAGAYPSAEYRPMGQ